MLRLLLSLLLLSGTRCTAPASACPAPATAPWLREQSQTWTRPDSSVRINLNSPGDLDPAKPTQLIIFALPNGNTIEQTLGCQPATGMDWHYDIQHIAAQTRKLRQIDPARNIMLACVEAKGLSWPAWRRERKDNGHQIRLLIDDIARRCRPAPAPGQITLAAHSGGGSFIFGFINSAPDIADTINRIAFLDANYAYSDEEHHGDKLRRWLTNDPSHQLIVIAYDDRNIQLNGKPVLKNPLGGTYGATKRMIDFFHPGSGTSVPLFQHDTGSNHQLDFLIHTNPDSKILHTRLVELNGFLYAMTCNTPRAAQWGAFFGDRAYTDLIAPPAPPITTQPQPQPTTTTTTAPATAPIKTQIPARSKDSIGGRAFMKQIDNVPLIDREAAIQKEILAGNIPDFLRRFVEVKVTSRGSDGRPHTGVFRALPDYLAIGSSEDFIRIPMTPASATIICKAFNTSLPTRKMVDAVYQSAAIKLDPKPLTEKREAVATFVQHNQIIQDQLTPVPAAREPSGSAAGPLTAGHKKDVILTPILKEKPKKVAIYGWHKLDGTPIQPLYTGHADFYVDYSHGIRLIAGTCIIDNIERPLTEVLTDPELSTLLSDEGPIDFTYPAIVRPPPVVTK